MTMTIALAGKGGTGKTTIAALIVRYLVEERQGSVLAIDADPASNLNMVLGMEVRETIGGIREEMLDMVQSSGALAGSLPGGMSKQEYLDYQVQMALVEGERVDLITMGRPEGLGCYCAANQMLRLIVDRLAKQYDYVVIDNEAGMEHLSRRTTRDVDVLLLVTDPTRRGLVTAGRMRDMVPGLDIGVGRMVLVVNRVRETARNRPPPCPPAGGGEWGGGRGAGGEGLGSGGAEGLPAPLAEAVKQSGLELIGTVPDDAAMAEFEFTGRPLVELPAETAVYRAVREIAGRIMAKVDVVNNLHM